MLRTRVTSVLWRSLNGRLERAALSGKVSGEDPGGVAGGTRGREGQEENRAATGGEQDKEPSVPVPLSRGNIGEGAAAAAQSSGNSGAGEEAASRSTRGGDAPPSPASAGTTAASGGAKPGGLGQEGNIASSGQMFEDRYAATGRAVLVKDRGPGRAAQAECLTRCAGGAGEAAAEDDAPDRDDNPGGQRQDRLDGGAPRARPPTHHAQPRSAHARRPRRTIVRRWSGSRTRSEAWRRR